MRSIQRVKCSTSPLRKCLKNESSEYRHTDIHFDETIRTPIDGLVTSYELLKSFKLSYIYIILSMVNFGDLGYFEFPGDWSVVLLVILGPEVC